MVGDPQHPEETQMWGEHTNTQKNLLSSPEIHWSTLPPCCPYVQRLGHIYVAMAIKHPSWKPYHSHYMPSVENKTEYIKWWNEKHFQPFSVFRSHDSDTRSACSFIHLCLIQDALSGTTCLVSNLHPFVVHCCKHWANRQHEWWNVIQQKTKSFF